MTRVVASTTFPPEPNPRAAKNAKPITVNREFKPLATAGADIVARFRQLEGELPPFPSSNDAASPPYGLYSQYDALKNPGYRMVDRLRWGAYAVLAEYDVVHVVGILDPDNPSLAAAISSRIGDYGRLFVISDAQVARLYAEAMARYLQENQIRFTLLQLDDCGAFDNEKNKSPNVWVRLLGDLVGHGISGGDALMAFGGGVCTDLVGFLASTIRRGMPYFAVPTTLAAQVDAALSPKTAVNIPHCKSAAGDLYPPECILWDAQFLITNDRRTLATGLAEMIKIGAMRSRELFECLERFGVELVSQKLQSDLGLWAIDSAIRMFLQIKWERRNPFPGNEPASLRTFGHFFSRWLESESEFLLSHGEAVAIEMAVSAQLACNAGVLPEDELERILRVLASFDLPTFSEECLDPGRIWADEFEPRDRRGQPVWFPCPNRIGAGGFLQTLTRRDFEYAVTCLSRKTMRRKVRVGRACFQERDCDIIADFFPDGRVTFAECEWGQVQWRNLSQHLCNAFVPHV